MSKLITSDDYQLLSVEFNLPIRLIKTVLVVESSGSGFNPKTGKIKIQFEAHWFTRLEKVKIINGVENQAEEWEAFEKAKAIDRDHALKSTSWGMAQIMGFNHKEAGYDTVDAMVSEFGISEYYQVKGMLKFISSKKLKKHLINLDWRAFARGYNGPLYEKFNYHTKLEDAYNRIKI